MSSYHILYFKQAIAAIIKPPVQDVVQFLKEHIQHDIRCIARSTGNSDDEAVQLIHLVLVGIVNNLSQLGGKISSSTLLMMMMMFINQLFCSTKPNYTIVLIVKLTRVFKIKTDIRQY